MESFSEFKATLEKRSKIRLELIEDLHTKRMLTYSVHVAELHEYNYGVLV